MADLLGINLESLLEVQTILSEGGGFELRVDDVCEIVQIFLQGVEVDLEVDILILLDG